MRHWIETSHARLGKPLRPADLRAFDRLDEALKDRRFRLELRLEPGDLLFCDNHKTGHDREDPAAPRLMVRLWLNRWQAAGERQNGNAEAASRLTAQTGPA